MCSTMTAQTYDLGGRLPVRQRLGRLASPSGGAKIGNVPAPNQNPSGGYIFSDHPFLPPEDERSPIRRLRGRLTAPVTLWTAGTGTRPAGLPVASTLVIEGDPAYVLGAIDEETALWDEVERAERFAVQVLRWEHRQVAEAFAGLLPSPGGPFRAAEWEPTEWGPVLTTVGTWVGCRRVAHRELGWSRLVEAEIEHVALGDEVDPLLHRRGHYVTVPSPDDE